MKKDLDKKKIYFLLLFSLLLTATIITIIVIVKKPSYKSKIESTPITASKTEVDKTKELSQLKDNHSTKQDLNQPKKVLKNSNLQPKPQSKKPHQPSFRSSP